MLKKMKNAKEVLKQAEGALDTEQYDQHAMAFARLGFDPDDDGTIHQMEIRSPKRKRSFSNSAKKAKNSTCEKTRYKDRQQAKEALKTIRYAAGISSSTAAKNAALPVREYPCYETGCFGYHLTSREELASLKRFGLAA
jgi:hypothetical protein